METCFRLFYRINFIQLWHCNYQTHSKEVYLEEDHLLVSQIGYKKYRKQSFQLGVSLMYIFVLAGETSTTWRHQAHESHLHQRGKHLHYRLYQDESEGAWPLGPGRRTLLPSASKHHMHTFKSCIDLVENKVSRIAQLKCQEVVCNFILSRINIKQTAFPAMIFYFFLGINIWYGHIGDVSGFTGIGSESKSIQVYKI